VAFKGWSGGYGRLIKVRHRNGYISYYGHLSRYANGLDVGERVRQKQVIGYVGMSGLATGPHLDFRLEVNGRLVNPAQARFPTGLPVPSHERTRFGEVAVQRLAELRAAGPPLILEAGM
jgi:murein DD-endopeptidase MepM/ murein hydrolase activator NlpD